MLLRKINAIISLITTLLFMDHAIFFTIWMLSKGSIEKSAESMPWILVGFTAAHAIISIIIAILDKKGLINNNGKSYPQKNATTYIQRISCAVMVLLLYFLHILGAENYFQPQILHAILHPIFFISAFTHVSISTSKAFITLGIGNAKIVKILDIAIKIICGLTLIACIIGFYICLF